MIKFYMILLFFIVALNQTSSQNVAVSDYGSTTKTKMLASESGKEYKITITVPRGYNEKSKYKVLYYVDSWWLKETVCGANALALLSKSIEPIVLVGVSIEGDEMDWHLHRNLDYTPSPYSKTLMGFTMSAGSVEIDSINTGGADRFIEFFETKVFNYIRTNYPNVEDRSFLGHSFGGLLGVYLLQTNPELFNNYILISPSVWWNRSEILEINLFDIFKPQEKTTKIYLTVGGAESKLLTKSVVKLDSLLSGFKTESLVYQFKNFQNANHNSVIPQSVYGGLEFLYGLNVKEGN